MRSNNKSPETEDQKQDENKIKLNNDIRDIRSIRQIDKVHLDFDSPRLKKAMEDLGVKQEEMEKKQVALLSFKFIIFLGNDLISKRKEWILK